MVTYKRTIRNSYYVYKLIDPRTNEPFYVGKGIGSRMYDHVTEAKLPKEFQSNPLKCNVINKIVGSGLKVIYRYELCETEEQALVKEAELISLYGRRVDGTGILTNISEAGCTANPVKKPVCQYTKDCTFVAEYESASDASRQLGINEDKLRRLLKGKDNMKTLKGFIFAFKGCPVSPFVDSRPKRVAQKDQAGNMICVFESTVQAARAIGIHPSVVRQCCKDTTKTGKGFTFEYV